MASSLFARALETANTWMDLPGVVAVGERKGRDGEDCIVVTVTTREAADEIPAVLQGFRVTVNVRPMI